jgi:hypothetical protein
MPIRADDVVGCDGILAVVLEYALPPRPVGSRAFAFRRVTGALRRRPRRDD